MQMQSLAVINVSITLYSLIENMNRMLQGNAVTL